MRLQRQSRAGCTQGAKSKNRGWWRAATAGESPARTACPQEGDVNQCAVAQRGPWAVCPRGPLWAGRDTSFNSLYTAPERGQSGGSHRAGLRVPRLDAPLSPHAGPLPPRRHPQGLAKPSQPIERGAAWIHAALPGQAISAPYADSHCRWLITRHVRGQAIAAGTQSR